MELKIDPNVSYALALEGGGAKGAYQIGAWKALREAGIRICAVAGTSVGALNGALIAAGDYDRAEELWENITWSQVMDVDDDAMRRFFRGEWSASALKALAEQAAALIRSRGFDVTPLQKLIREAVPEDRVKSADTELYIVTYSVSDQKLLELRAADLEPGELADMLLASAYLPVFRAEKLGGKRYADGGVRDVLPLHVLVENGYKNIIALRLFGVGVERPVRIPRGTEVLTVAPRTDLGGTLEFDAEQSRKNLRSGYFDTMRLLYGLAGTDYYIDPRWSEEQARAFLSRASLRVGAALGWTLRSVHERLLPALARKYDTDKGGYLDLAHGLMEAAAKEIGADPWRICSEEELLYALGGEAACDRLILAEAEAQRPPREESPEPVRSSGDGDIPDKLRVCLLNDSFPPVVDGVANAVVNYARCITASEAGCAVATPDYPGAVDDYPFPVIRYPSVDTSRLVGYRAGNPFSLSVTNTLSEMDFDIIHSHCPVASTILARVLRENIQKPLVFTYHTKFDIDIENAVRSPRMQETAVKLLVNNIAACDEVWVVSRGAGENLRSLGYEGDYVVMPNGVDVPRGRASDAAVAALSEKWDLRTEAPVYLFLGRIMWYKGLRIILDGLKLVKDAGQDFRMVFVGDGMDRGEVEAYARELGLYDRCRFVGAERDRETVRAWYTRADLFLFPSTFDTNGLVVREAAACSLGSVLIRGSCAAEDIVDGDTGVLIDETAEALAAALLSPRADRETLRRIGRSASEKIYLSWDDAVARAREQYRSVLRRWRSGELRRKRVPFDGFFDLTGDVTEALDKARNMLDSFMEKYL